MFRNADPARLPPDEKLAAFRLIDPFGQWQSLDDQRCCTLCKRIFNGRQVEIIGARLQCPTPQCASAPADWKTPMGSDGRTLPDSGEFTFLF